MNTQPPRQAFGSTRLASGFVLSLALLSAACTDPTAPSESGILPGSLLATSGAAAPGYTVLANQAVTCTDGTITGDVGTFQAAPTGSITLTTCPVSGSVDVGTTGAKQAFNAFLAQYAALAPEAGDVCTVLSGTLDGVTLAPGAYCFPAAAVLTGTLTLDGPSNGLWSFSIGTSGTGALTGTNFSVVLANGAQSCNISWWVAEAATMTTSNFQGNILAGAAITLTGGTFHGAVWSHADVTITGTEVVGCEGSNGQGKPRGKCNQGVGNGPEGCDPGNSNHRHGSNDENGGTPGNPGRR
jgi:ice-binding like protein